MVSARPSSSALGFEHTSGAASSTDCVVATSSESETEAIDVENHIVDAEQPLEPLPPPPAEYLVDWDFLKRAGVTLADPSKGEVIWTPETGDPLNPPFQGKILCNQRSCFSIDYHNVLDFHRTSWRSATRYWGVSEPNLAEYLPKDVPFSSLPSDASSAVRRECITLDRIIRFGASPECKACSELKGRHNSTCKARFDMLVKAETAANLDKPSEPPAEGSSHVDHLTAIEAGITSAEDKTADTPVDAEADESAVHPDDLPFSAGIPPAAVGKAVQFSN